MKTRLSVLFVSVPMTLLLVAGPVAAEGCILGLLCVKVPSVTVPGPSPAPAPAPPLLEDTLSKLEKLSIDGLENLMLTKVNAERALAGLGALAENGWANDIARSHAQAMANAGTIWHNPNYMAQGRSAMGANLLGENVAMDISIAGAHLALMNSPSHRHNILDGRFNSAGIGVAVKGLQVYVTQAFASIPGGAAPKPAAAPKAAVPKAVKPPVAPAVKTPAVLAETAPPVETIALPSLESAKANTAASPAKANSPSATPEKEAPKETLPVGTKTALGGGTALLVATSLLLARRFALH